MAMLTILDVNNFWSPVGGGVRRYHLEKLAFMRSREDLRYVFVQPDEGDWTESERHGLVIEHVEAPTQPRTEDYRMIVQARKLRELVQLHRPHVIECGSPALLPVLLHLASFRLNPRPALVGFWHADFPRAYVGRKLGEIDPRLGARGEEAAWWWARRGYGSFDAVFVASRSVGRELIRHGLERLYYTPLGVDSERFSPSRRDLERVRRFKAGVRERPVIIFAHRMQDEKGLGALMRAYDELCHQLPHAPALVFAGTGPDRPKVEALAARREHVHDLGYVESAVELAHWYASCDIGLALSGFETFGLSCAEAMASGLAMVAANEGAAAELVEGSGCGLTVPFGDSRVLTRALRSLIEEGELRERGAKGRAFVERFSWPDCFERELCCYREIVDLRHRGQKVPKGLNERMMPAELAEGSPG